MAKSSRPSAAPSSGVASDKGVYSISVAAELAGTGAQNLRRYEARGLLEPDRTGGGTRRYSEDDIVRLQRIGQLLEDGLNLAGIGQMLDLEAENADLRRQNAALRTSRGEDRRPPRA